MDFLASIFENDTSTKSDAVAERKKDLIEVPLIVEVQIDIINNSRYDVKINVGESPQVLPEGKSQMFPLKGTTFTAGGRKVTFEFFDRKFLHVHDFLLNFSEGEDYNTITITDSYWLDTVEIVMRSRRNITFLCRDFGLLSTKYKTHVVIPNSFSILRNVCAIYTDKGDCVCLITKPTFIKDFDSMKFNVKQCKGSGIVSLTIEDMNEEK